MIATVIITSSAKGDRKIQFASGNGRNEFRDAVASGKCDVVEIATLQITKRWRRPKAAVAAKTVKGGNGGEKPDKGKGAGDNKKQ